MGGQKRTLLCRRQGGSLSGVSGHREAGATSLVTGPGPVVDEVAEAVVVAVDVAVRRGMMSHREQFLDVADAPRPSR